MGNGQQFITGQCASAADCASGCCVEQPDGTGQCKAQLVTEESGGSCDFVCGASSGAAGGGEEAAAGDDAPPGNAAPGGAAEEDTTDETVEVEYNVGAGNGTIDDGAGAGNGTDTGGADGGSGGTCGDVAPGDGSQNVGLGDGSQFITGQCFSPADCASGCCADQGNGIATCGAQDPTENERGQTCDFTCSAT